PSCRPRILSRGSARPDSITTGMSCVSGSSLRSLSTSQPSIPPIMTSRTLRSGRSPSAVTSASSPLGAVSTRWPRLANATSSMWSRSGSSSTTRIVCALMTRGWRRRYRLRARRGNRGQASEALGAAAPHRQPAPLAGAAGGGDEPFPVAVGPRTAGGEVGERPAAVDRRAHLRDQRQRVVEGLGPLLREERREGAATRPPLGQLLGEQRRHLIG